MPQSEFSNAIEKIRNKPDEKRIYNAAENEHDVELKLRSIDPNYIMYQRATFREDVFEIFEGLKSTYAELLRDSAHYFKHENESLQHMMIDHGLEMNNVKLYRNPKEFHNSSPLEAMVFSRQKIIAVLTERISNNPDLEHAYNYLISRRSKLFDQMLTDAHFDASVEYEQMLTKQ
jgi:hypothetical protein